MNPFENIKKDLKAALQGQIDKLGIDFFNHESAEDPQTNTALTWSGFGADHHSWYFVAMYENRSFGENTVGGWLCIGQAVIDATTLNWDKVNKAEVAM